MLKELGLPEHTHEFHSRRDDLGDAPSRPLAVAVRAARRDCIPSIHSYCVAPRWSTQPFGPEHVADESASYACQRRGFRGSRIRSANWDFAFVWLSHSDRGTCRLAHYSRHGTNGHANGVMYLVFEHAFSSRLANMGPSY